MTDNPPINNEKNTHASTDPSSKLFLIVTGMHRSGTSFLVRAFNLCGVDLGDPEDLYSDEWRPESDNIRGHWENKEILQLAEETLALNGGSWDKIPEKIVIDDNLSNKIKIFIKKLNDNPSVAVGFKDPRIIVCLEGWHQFLPPNFTLIGIFRHPLKVAESLKIRNNFTYEKSLDLWYDYNRKLLSLIEKYNGFLLDFDWQQDKLFSEFALICKKIGLPNIDLSQWYDKELLHSDKSFESKFKLDSELASLYSKLQKRSLENENVNARPIVHNKTNLEIIIKNLLLQNERQGEYFRQINDKNLKIIENLSDRLPEDPLGLLLSLYAKRQDLQEHYPEVLKGDYENLLEWAYNVCSKTIADDSYEILTKHSNSYLQIINAKNFLKNKNITEKNFKISTSHMVENTNPLYILMSIYNLREDLRTKFPEVKNGEYANLINWARSVSNEQVADSAIVLLKEFAVWYKKESEKMVELTEFKDSIEHLEKQIAENSDVYTRRMEELQKLRNEDARRMEELQKLRNEDARRMEDLRIKNKNLKEQTQFLDNSLNNITSSVAYHITKKITSSLDKGFPPHTWGGKLLKKGSSSLRKKYQLSEPNQPIKDPAQNKTKIPEYLFESENIGVYRHAFEKLTHKPKFSIITPTFNTDKAILDKTIKSVEEQYYPNWELCICDDGSSNKETKELLKDRSFRNPKLKVVFSETNEGISTASNKALDLASGEYVILLDHDDMLTKNALMEIAIILNKNTDIDFIYSDEDKIDEKDNHMEPFFKPDWSPDLLFSYNYPIHVSVFRKSILQKIGGFRKQFDGSQDYDVILRFIEITNKIVHIPKVLYSWRKISGSTALSMGEKNYAYDSGKDALSDAIRRRKIDAIVENGIDSGRYRIKYAIKEKPLVSVIIPTRNMVNLKTCLTSIFDRSSYNNLEIIVLDNSTTHEIKNFCSGFRQVKRLDISGWKFNFSRFNNYGVTKSNGKYLIFLNDDTEVISPDWIECLLEHAQRKEIGIVGAKLLYRNDHVQHAGTVIGIDGYAGNYGGMYYKDGGYFSYANVIRDCSAVTAACMMMKRETFVQVGGYEEDMAHSWQDVDLCLKVMKSGYYILYTPYSVLYHYEGGTRGKRDITNEEEKAKDLFRTRHLEFIRRGDPFYNPNLSLVNPFAYVLKFNDPIEVLDHIFNTRRDLQLAFPNDDRYGFKSMIDWAATHGVTTDNHKQYLLPFYEYYFSHCSNDAKPFAEKIRRYINDPDLREKFPEVVEGKYDRYLEYTNNETIAKRT